MPKFVRSRSDGQLGEIVEHDGKQMVRLDRQHDTFRPYNPEDWAEDSGERPLTKPQVGRIAYEADRALRLALGEHTAAASEWISLKDEARIKWTREGPPKGTLRAKLYRAVTAIFPDAR